MSAVAHIESVLDTLHRTGSPFEIGELEIRGRSYTGYVNAPDQVRELWLAIKADDAEEYLIYEDERITYGEARSRVLQLANALIDDFGVKPGDSVGLALRNYPEWVLGWWAIQMAGAVVVQLNSFWNGEELTYGVTDSGASVMIVDQQRHDDLVPHVDEIRSMGVNVVMVVVRPNGSLLDGSVRWDDLSGPESIPDVQFGPEDHSVMVYTSGTTAFPKGVVHSQRNVVSNYLNMLVFALTLRMAEESANGNGPKLNISRTSMLVAVPLFHVTGSHCVMLPVTGAGGKLVLMYKWDASKALELVEREQVTNFTGVPTMTIDMLASPDFKIRDTSSLKTMGSGGAPNPPHMVGEVNERVENASATQGYGLSEVSGIATSNGGVFYREKPTSCGFATRAMQLKVVDDFGEELPSGERGELLIRGPHVFVEYHNKPEATAAAIDEDGWFHTGDIATIDEDGFVSIVDRAKDVVIRGGENIGSAEVEAVIARHPAVHECAVFGVAHERLGEEVAVAVHLAAGAKVGVKELQEFARESLATFKVPVHVFIHSEPLPKNPNGKVLKRDLRDQAAADLSIST